MLKTFHKMMRRNGQSTLEYAILIVIVLGALLTIQVYIKRGLQGRLKSATDDIGIQYSDGNQNSNTTTLTSSTSVERFGAAAGGQGISETDLQSESTNEIMNSFVFNVDQEYWGNDPAP